MIQLGRLIPASYLALARIGARQELFARGPLIARAAFLVVILLVFSQLWSAVLEVDSLGGLHRADLLWYLAVTEWVVLSFPLVHHEVSGDVQSGSLVVRLTQPIPYPAARLAEAAGATCARMAVLGPMGAAAATALAGGPPASVTGLAFVVPLGLLAAGFALLSVVGIGVASVWVSDPSPLYWIWQKLTFVLGGLMLPLSIYPEWLQSFAALTPFAPMLNGTASATWQWDPAGAVSVAGRLLAWDIGLSLALVLLWRRALCALDTSGG